MNAADFDRMWIGTGAGDDTVAIDRSVKLGVTIDGGDGDDLLNGGSGNDTLTGGLGSDRIDGGAGINTLQEVADVDFTLTNTSLLGLGVDRLAKLQVATLIGGARPNTFTVSGWTGKGTFSGGNDLGNTLVATKNVNFTLTDTSLKTSDGLDLGLAGFTHAVLTGGNAKNTFDLSGWTGTGTVNGGAGDDRLVVTRDADMTLSNSALSLGGASPVALIRVEQAALTGGAGGNTFDLTGWTGTGAVTGGGGVDVIRVVADSDFTLSNTQLTVAEGFSIKLAGISSADLTGGAANNTFNIGAWTGTGRLDGGLGANQLIAVRDADMALTDTMLASPGGPALALGGIQSARLTGGVSANLLDASGFTRGSVTLQGGAGNDILVGGSQDDLLDGGDGARHPDRWRGRGQPPGWEGPGHSDRRLQ